MVVYQHHDEEGNLTMRARPLSVWQEKAIVDGKEVERFTYIGE